MDKYRLQMEALNFEYLKKCIKKETIPTHEEYLEKLNEHFHDRSKEHLIIHMYNEVPVRDDFQLLIVKTKLEAKSRDINYLVLNRRTCTIILNHYKTARSYGQKCYELSQELKKKVEAYIANNQDGSGYLFGNSQQSAFISGINRQLGYSGGIGLLRKIKVTDAYKADTSYEYKQELASKMCHSIQEALLVYSGKLHGDDDA